MRSRIPTYKPILKPFLRSPALGGVMSNCVGYWTSRAGNVAKGGTLLDNSGNGNHGVCKNKCHWVQGEGGIFNDATDDRVEVPNNTSLDFIDAFTINVWVKGKPEDIDDYVGFVSRGNSTRSFVVGAANDGEPRLILYKTDGSRDIIYSQTPSVYDNKYHMITGILRNGTAYIFVGGVLENKDSWDYELRQTSNPFFIGQSISQYKHTGLIDEVFALNCGLIENQAWVLYNIQRPWILGR